MKKISLPEKIITVLCYGRGGSGLWSSLLDGHPKILTLPDCILANFFWFWEQNEHLPAGDLIDLFIKTYIMIFDATLNNPALYPRIEVASYLKLTHLGENKDTPLYVDQKLFKKYMENILDFSQKTSRKKFFQAIHVAYAQAQGKEVLNDSIISFGLHVAEDRYTNLLIEDFPQCVFLQTVRNPCDGIGSWFRHVHTSSALSDLMLTDALRAAFDIAYISMPSNSLRWVTIRLEDTHKYKEEVVRKILCDWIGLEWNPCLIESTYNGLKWWNEKNTMQTNGFNEKITNQRFDKYLNKIDRYRLNQALQNRREAWKYCEKQKPSFLKKLIFIISLVLPFKMEKYCWASKKRHNSLDDVNKTLVEKIFKACKLYILVRKKLIHEFLFPSKKLQATNVISMPEFDITSIVSGKDLLSFKGKNKEILEKYPLSSQ